LGGNFHARSFVLDGGVKIPHGKGIVWDFVLDQIQMSAKVDAGMVLNEPGKND